jgi:hypothetical protein
MNVNMARFADMSGLVRRKTALGYDLTWLISLKNARLIA